MALLNRARKVGKKFLNPVPTTIGGLSLMLKVLPRYLTNREEHFPAVLPGPFHTDPAIFASASASGLRVTWLGHTSTLLETDGVRVLIDPVWDARVSPVSWMGPKRFFAPPLALDDLPRIDIVLISHDHYDHLGEATVKRLASLSATSKAQWVTSLGVGAILRSFGVAGPIAELDWTETLTVGDLQITALPARHFSGRSLGNRFQTLWSSFVLKGPQHTVYFGADSGWWEGFAEIGAAYGPFDLTMLEIGAYDDLWKDLHLGPDGAIRAFQAMGGKGLLMPTHWGLFDLALHGWRHPMERLVIIADEQGVKLWSPQPGRPTEVVPGAAHVSKWWHRLDPAQ